MRRIRVRTARRITDAVGDILLVAWGVLWFLLSRSLEDLMASITDPVGRLGTTTGAVADRLDETASALEEVPLVGEQLAAPFPGMAASMRDLSNHLATQVASLQVTSGWVVPAAFLVPTLIAAVLYIRWRVLRVQETHAARALLSVSPNLDLFALRGMSISPLTRIRTVHPDPVTAWRAGDPTTIRRLANVEMRRVGLEYRDQETAAHTSTER